MAISKRVYPQVSSIKDQPTQQSIKILWDRMWDHIDNLNATIDKLTTAQADIVTLKSDVTSATNLARNASKPFAAVAKIAPGSPDTGAGGVNPPSDNGSSTPGDGGAGMQGCSLASASGHVDPALPRDRTTAGMIVCGVGLEFPALLVITANQTIRDTNRADLLNRMIWHLNQQGFPAAHYGSPPNAFLLLIQFGSDQSAYRVTGYETFETTMTTTMVFGGTTLGAGVIPDGGTPD